MGIFITLCLADFFGNEPGSPACLPGLRPTQVGRDVGEVEKDEEEGVANMKELCENIAWLPKMLQV